VNVRVCEQVGLVLKGKVGQMLDFVEPGKIDEK
jgi:hypothetical protein